MSAASPPASAANTAGPAAVILAAGAGTRMKSMLPKCLHPVACLPMLGHVIKALQGAGVSRIVVVTSKDGDAVRAFAENMGASPVIQHEQLGTGHAARMAADALAGFDGPLIVAIGDMPLVTAATYRAVLAAGAETGMAIVAFNAADPAHYGRVLTGADGYLTRIVEYRDASEAQRAVTVCNAGIVCADAKSFFRWASKLGNDNAQREYYLTDVPALAQTDGVRCAVTLASETEVMGVNSRAELAIAESHMQARLRAGALANGVGMTAPETVFLAHDTVLEPDVSIAPHVVFGPGVRVASGVQIKSFTHLEGAVIAANAAIGPYARLRPDTSIAEGAHIGNFVETKNAVIERGVKANHLTYIGDARIGAGTNIGAGTITCNYDGSNKSHTDIGANAFVGSNTALVAPVSVGDGAIIGAGSVVTKDVPANAVAVARADLKIADGADRLRARNAAKKKKKD